MLSVSVNVHENVPQSSEVVVIQTEQVSNHKGKEVPQKYENACVRADKSHRDWI